MASLPQPARVNRTRPQWHGHSAAKTHYGTSLCAGDKKTPGRASQVCNGTDYKANLYDPAVLQYPARAELEPEEITNVFGYPRNFEEKDVFENDEAIHLDVFENDIAIDLVMQLCEGGALLDRIESQTGEGGYSEKYIARLVRSILRFVSQCHSKGFIYRDIKPDNFLFLSNDVDSPLKATDFGLAVPHFPGEPPLSSRSGTPAYMAPELVLQAYDGKSDVWSVGMIAYQLLTGRFPYWDNVREESLANVWKAILSDEIEWDSPELVELSRPAITFLKALLQRADGTGHGLPITFLKALLQRDPESRPSAAEALDHPWVREDGVAMDRPLQGSVVQRLQRFSTYSALKQLVLKLIMDKMQHSPDSEIFLSVEDTPLDTTASLGTLAVELLGKKMDFDRDSTIDMTEFLTTLVDWSAVQQGKHWQAKQMLRESDKDGDGKNQSRGVQ
eukprot:gene21458-28430_t